jgi:hypothetical protein
MYNFHWKNPNFFWKITMGDEFMDDGLRPSGMDDG